MHNTKIAIPVDVGASLGVITEFGKYDDDDIGIGMSIHLIGDSKNFETRYSDRMLSTLEEDPVIHFII